MLISWLDLMALFVLATGIALGVRVGSSFTLAVVPSLVCYVVLAGFLPNSILPGVALVLGLVMAFITQYIPLPRLSDTVEGVVGGFGGAAWGLALAVIIWVSFPSEYVASSGTLRYPSSQLAPPVAAGISSSPFARPLFRWASSNPTLRVLLLPHVRR